MRSRFFAFVALLLTLLSCSEVDREPMRMGVGAGIGHGRQPHPSLVRVGSVDFSAATPGPLSLPSGYAIQRASDASVEKSGSTAAFTVGGSNVARARYRSGFVGLAIEGGTTNYAVNTNALTGGGWNNDATVTAGQTGPDGLTGAYRYNYSTNHQAFSSTTLAVANNVPFTWSFWGKQSTLPSVQAEVGVAGIQQYHNFALTNAWAPYSFTWSLFSSPATAIVAPVVTYDGSSHGGVTATASDLFLQAPQFELGPRATTWTSSSRFGEVLADTANGALIHAKLNLHIVWRPDISATDAVTIGLSRMRLWAVDSATKVELEPARRVVHVVVDGVDSTLPTLLPSWSADSPFVFDISSVGNGAPSGTYAYGGGATTSLGMGAVSLPPLRASASTLYWFGAPSPSSTTTWNVSTTYLVGQVVTVNGVTYRCVTSGVSASSGSGPTRQGNAVPDGTVMWASTPDQQATGIVTSFSLTTSVAQGLPPHTFYASPSGSPSGAGTPASLASLSRAIALAEAFLPASPGQVRVVLHGGTYFLTTTLALTQADSGLELVNFPGETPVISGGTLLSGWVDDGSGQGVSKASLSTPTRDLWVNDVRSLRAASSITSNAWTVTSTGFTTSDAAIINAYARPTDVQIKAINDWRWFEEPVVSSTSTTITTGVTAAANNNANPLTPIVLWWENARELLTSSTPGKWYWNAGTNFLHYKPRANETLGSATVIAGTLANVITVTGTQSNNAAVTFRGITVSHSYYNEPATSAGFEDVSTCFTGFHDGNVAGMSVHKPASAAMVFRYASGSALTGVSVAHTSGIGVDIQKGTRGFKLLGSRFFDNGGTAVMIGDVQLSDAAPSDTRDWVSDITVKDSHFTGDGVMFPSCPEVEYLYAGNVTIQHNTFTHVYAAAVSGGWGWNQVNPNPLSLMANNLIDSNTVSDVKVVIAGTGANSVIHDEGPLYVQGGPQTNGRITNNYVDWNSDVGSFACIYLDGGTSLWAIEGNVCNGQGMWLFLQNNGNLTFHAQNNDAGSTTPNYWVGRDVNSGAGAAHPSNTIGSNVNSVTSSSALAIQLAAGRE